MKRLLMDELVQWKRHSGRKPLLIQGARQVGKTWLMKEFGRLYFSHTVYVNFDRDERMRQVFEQDLDIERIIAAIEIDFNMRLSAEDTLIIFDEIQEVPKALTSLKYFCEDAPMYYIIAAGSFLGVTLHPGTSFPVGKVEFAYLYPLTYCEFLMAMGEDGLAKIFTQGDYEMMSVFADKFEQLLRLYYYVGGMPEVVSTYVDSRDLKAARRIQRFLLNFYPNDFSKHAPIDLIPRLHMVWNSIPAQLSKENKKFVYGNIKQGARAREFELALQWLQDSGLIHKCVRISKPDLPLIAYEDGNAFKVYFLDVGLLAAWCELDAGTLLDGNAIFTEFKGALTEQYVASELIAAGFGLHYYTTPNSSGEIDFLIQRNGAVIPIEAKAETNLRAKSLRAYMDKYNPSIAVRTSMAGYRTQERLTNVPLYALAGYLRRHGEE